MKLILRVFIVLILVLGGVYLLGPDEPMTGEITFEASALGDDIENYLKNREAAFSDIRDGLEKEVIWANPASKEKTTVSVVYIHGFSASKAEVRPVTDNVATANNANLFYTRLRGHGRTPASMGEMYVDDWLNDGAEALAIGSNIGEKSIVIATSTGAGITTWLAANRSELFGNVAAIVFISPNFGLHPPLSTILRLPFVRSFLPILNGGANRQVERESEAERHGWTTPYRVVATVPMAKITEEAFNSDVSTINIPAYFVYSTEDMVVVPSNTEAIMERWGGPTSSLIINDSQDDSNHVITGDIRSPNTTKRVSEAINSWLQSTIRP